MSWHVIIAFESSWFTVPQLRIIVTKDGPTAHAAIYLMHQIVGDSDTSESPASHPIFQQYTLTFVSIWLESPTSHPMFQRYTLTFVSTWPLPLQFISVSIIMQNIEERFFICLREDK